MKSNNLLLDLHGFTVGDIVKSNNLKRNNLFVVVASEYDAYELMICVLDIKNGITRWDLPDYYKKLK